MIGFITLTIYFFLIAIASLDVARSLQVTKYRSAIKSARRKHKSEIVDIQGQGQILF